MFYIMLNAQWPKNPPITSHQGNIEHSQTIMSLLTDLPCYEIKLPQILKNTAIRLDNI